MRRAALYAILPLALLALVIGAFLVMDPLQPLGVTAPPIEHLTVERTVLDANGIALRVRATGSDPVEIAQVQVDGAYWQFVQEPPSPIAHLQSAWVRIAYPWVANETHLVRFITRSGLTFDHTIEVAQATPRLGLQQLMAYGLLGLYVGVLPVGLGMLFYPLLRRLGPRGLQFVLALTVGLLAFLLVDTLDEGLELGARAAPGLQGQALVWLAAACSFIALTAIGRRAGHTPEGTALATYIAVGIGLHNFGEGLAIGAAFASGQAALGSFLVIGFTLHNVTEGVGIAVPMVDRRPPLWIFVGLTALAGAPAVLGAWSGAFAYAPQWGALLLGVGAGAILQVIVELGRYLIRISPDARRQSALSSGVAGFVSGVGVMYATSLLVSF